MADTTKRKKELIIQSITGADIVDAFGQGLRDFRAAPAFGLFFGAIYAAGGMVVIAVAYAFELTYIAYPLGAGFALIGPFVAVGLYQVSRRLEAGEALSWPGILGVIFAQRHRELGWMSFVTLFVLLMWMYQVRILLAIFLGLKTPPTLDGFLDVLINTPEGWMFLIVGHGVGAVLALILFSLTVVSFPMLLDRDVDFITAMITSVKSVIQNPVAMIGWAAVVVLSLIVAIAPSFLGLLIVLPILGHTTWHLYKKLVPPPSAP